MTEPLPLERQLAQAWNTQEWRRQSVILAVSGGPDSVAMLRAMERTNAAVEPPARLIVAHFHHGWRTAEADQDALFVRQLAEASDLPYREGRAEKNRTGSGHQGLGPEGVARRERYQFLLAMAHQSGARFVATAHTADDQVETILHRILRGTGLRGLRGIPRRRLLGEDVMLIRPLLDAPRSEIEAYLTQLGQATRHDHTNDSTRYTRNRLRKELLPTLRERYNPHVDAALLRLAEMAGDLTDWNDDITAQVWQAAVRVPGDLRDPYLPARPPQVGDASPQSDMPTSGAMTAPIKWRVAILLAPLRQFPKFAVQQLLLAVWRRENWPLRKLSHQAVTELADMLLAPVPSQRRRQAPGGVDIQIQDNVAWFSRSIPTIHS